MSLIFVKDDLILDITDITDITDIRKFYLALAKGLANFSLRKLDIQILK